MKTLERVRLEYCIVVLNRFDGNKQLAAKSMGISTKTLYNILDTNAKDVIFDRVERVYFLRGFNIEIEEVVEEVKQPRDINEICNEIYEQRYGTQ